MRQRRKPLNGYLRCREKKSFEKWAPNLKRSRGYAGDQLNAIYNAVGVRVSSIPVNKEKLAKAIQGNKIY